MFKKFLTVGIALILVVAVSGCSLFVPSHQSISIDGQPAGAKVVVNGNPCYSPCKIEVPRNKMLEIDVYKDGYHPYTMYASYSLSQTGMLDLAGAWFFIVPAIGFFSPGAFSLEKDTFYYVLTPVEK